MNPTAYATLDKAAPAAKLYYRLRQVDLDGGSSFSPVVTVAGSGEIAKVELYPNPAHSRISFIAEAATPYRVLNQLGQSLLHGTTEAGTASIGLEALPTGLYFLELQTAAGRTVQKFEKTTD
nr:T9SS type A sorting domain-containing protein [Hymenobacter siberiensis]